MKQNNLLNCIDDLCFYFLDKFQIVHDKQQHSSGGPGGSFGYGGGGRRMGRGGAYFPASFVWCHEHIAYFFIIIKKIFFAVKTNWTRWWTRQKETFFL